MLDTWPITIPQLTGDEERNAYVYVPEGYDEDARFPVLYMFDGQNLFHDEDASFGRSWRMLDYFEGNDIPVIIAAVECNHHPETDECGGRLSEYSPFDFYSPHWGDVIGRGKITMDWFVEEFKPYVDDNYPTLPEREFTWIGGSSMGGLMTLYALCCYNEVFSKGAAISPAIGFSFNEVKQMIRSARIRKKTILFADFGEQEIKHPVIRKDFGEVIKLLHRKKVMLNTRILPGGTHSEESWEKEIPHFMNIFLED
ncbi:MAG: alpha/beta hydrolase [Erysipelotrichaceae bacterium]|nr:alpha/beta hydrolase [Erysipelotrichaceae bacterium]